MHSIWGALPLVHGIAALWGYYHAARKALTMWQTIFSLVLQVYFLVAAMVMAVERAGQADGAAKKADAAARIQALVDPLLPKWARFVVDPLVPALIDDAVEYAHSKGLFTHAPTVPAAPAAAAPDAVLTVTTPRPVSDSEVQ